MPWQRTTHSESDQRDGSGSGIRPAPWVSQTGDTAIPNKTDKSKVRMIDWLYGLQITIAAPLSCFLIVLVGGVALDSMAPSYARIIGPWIAWPSLLAIIGSVPLALFANLMGYVFDPATDTLTYPAIMFRRSIAISETRDANAQTISSRHTIDLGPAAEKNRRRTILKRLYRVNVSGDFGVRIMRFGARYKRDQFLSILHIVAPDCRITRGYWY